MSRGLGDVYKRQKKDILKNAPNSDDEFIIVPKVVGENADN